MAVPDMSRIHARAVVIPASPSEIEQAPLLYDVVRNIRARKLYAEKQHKLRAI